MEKEKIEFPEALRRERARFQISRHDVAGHCGVLISVFKKWERGDAIPNTQQWKRLSGLLPRVIPYAPSPATLARAVMDGTFAESAAEAKAVLAREIANGTLIEPVKPPMQPFGEGLRRVREENEISCDELGEILGVSGAAVSQWESERNAPVIPNLDKLFDVLPELKAGIEVGAIKRPPSQAIPVPDGGRKFPRASTIDTAVQMAIEQSDVERSKVTQHVDLRQQHNDWSTAPEIVVLETTPTVRPEVIKLLRREVRRCCPCGGEVVDDYANTAEPWVCSRCRRRLGEPEVITAGREREIGDLALAAARARIAFAKAKLAEQEAFEALTNAQTARANASRELDDANALLDLAVEEVR